LFVERLRQISERLGGVRGLALVAQDGIPVESYGGSADLELEVLCAELLDQVRLMNEDHRDLQAGAVDQLTLVTDRVSLVVSRLSREYYLLAALPADVPVGRARFELRRAQLLFEDDLA
jgi:predicted regulator of Ras-like GTPase activity (Roadblock/LC7/MglB family)